MNKEKKPIKAEFVKMYIEIENLANTSHKQIMDRVDCPRNVYFLTNRADSLELKQNFRVFLILLKEETKSAEKSKLENILDLTLE